MENPAMALRRDMFVFLVPMLLCGNAYHGKDGKQLLVKLSRLMSVAKNPAQSVWLYTVGAILVIARLRANTRFAPT